MRQADQHRRERAHLVRLEPAWELRSLLRRLTVLLLPSVPPRPPSNSPMSGSTSGPNICRAQHPTV